MSVAEIDRLADDLKSLLDDARRSGEAIQIVDHGEIVAHIVPSPPVGAQYMTVDQLAERLARPPDEDPLTSEATRAIRRAQTEAVLARLKELEKEISAQWPEGVSAVDAIRDVRRDL